MANISLSSSNLIIGTHVPFDKTLTRTINFAISMGMYSFQFFLGSPQSFIRTQLKETDIKDVLCIINKYPFYIFTHAPYVYNLAKEENKDIQKSLQNELDQVVSFCGNGVVLHPGSNMDKKGGIDMISNNISKINFKDRSRLIIENMSGQGNMIGSKLEELRDIREKVDKDKQKYIEFCIDTAHIWGMGLYNLSKKDEIDKMFDDLEKILGIENIALFHVNDSKAKFGSKLDRHELLCNGEIWGNGKGDSLRYLLNKINSYNIPIILETDPSDMLKFLY
jgi:apurinic endonuclease APN1